MWLYDQRSGKLLKDGKVVAVGWSGQRQWKNDPESQCVKNKGPLPRGHYTILAPYNHPHLGPYVMNLEPDPQNAMCERGDFRIHGAALSHPELSSEGCIILSRAIREMIWVSGDHLLEVVAESEVPTDASNAEGKAEDGEKETTTSVRLAQHRQ